MESTPECWELAANWMDCTNSSLKMPSLATKPFASKESRKEIKSQHRKGWDLRTSIRKVLSPAHSSTERVTICLEPILPVSQTEEGPIHLRHLRMNTKHPTNPMLSKKNWREQTLFGNPLTWASILHHYCNLAKPGKFKGWRGRLLQTATKNVLQQRRLPHQTKKEKNQFRNSRNRSRSQRETAGAERAKDKANVERAITKGCGAGAEKDRRAAKAEAVGNLKG